MDLLICNGITYTRIVIVNQLLKWCDNKDNKIWSVPRLGETCKSGFGYVRRGRVGDIWRIKDVDKQETVLLFAFLDDKGRIFRLWICHNQELVTYRSICEELRANAENIDNPCKTRPFGNNARLITSALHDSTTKHTTYTPNHHWILFALHN